MEVTVSDNDDDDVLSSRCVVVVVMNTKESPFSKGFVLPHEESREQ